MAAQSGMVGTEESQNCSQESSGGSGRRNQPMTDRSRPPAPGPTEYPKQRVAVESYGEPQLVSATSSAGYSFMPANAALRCQSNNAD